MGEEGTGVWQTNETYLDITIRKISVKTDFYALSSNLCCFGAAVHSFLSKPHCIVAGFFPGKL